MALKRPTPLTSGQARLGDVPNSGALVLRGPDGYCGCIDRGAAAYWTPCGCLQIVEMFAVGSGGMFSSDNRVTETTSGAAEDR
jgi:hypothetical protein